MKKLTAALSAAVMLGATLYCAKHRPNLAPRPEALGFPLMEAGSLAFEGTANSPVRERYGTAYFTTAEGSVYAVDVPSKRAIWRFQASNPVPSAPELGEESLLVRDGENTIYVLDFDGRLVLKSNSPAPIATAVREYRNKIYFGSSNGRIFAVDPIANGAVLWEFDAGAAVASGPVFSAGLIIFGMEDGRIVALTEAGRSSWTFAARGTVTAGPTASGDRLYFGTAERFFYALAASTGKKKWQFRLPAALLQPPVIAGKRLVLAGSDSVVYCLSARSGEILWWQAVPSRVVHCPSVADGIVVVSSLSPDIAGYNLRGGYPVGRYAGPEDLLAGAVWLTPYLFVIESDPATAGERMVFLVRDRRPVQTLGDTNPIRR
jgi:outer membrane protein assembly factor BamB